MTWIKRVKIDRYDYLPPFDGAFSNGLNLVYGPNGSGKTLIIEAITKYLTRGRGWHGRNRVNEKPEGFLVLADKKQEHKVSTSTSIQSFLPLDPDQIQNLLIVRDSDLQISRKEKRFYQTITQQLLGIEPEKIKVILKAILERGRLTPTKEYSNAASLRHPAETLRKARELRAEIRSFLENHETQKLEEIEISYFENSMSIGDLENEIVRLEKAKKSAEYAEINNKISNLTGAIHAGFSEKSQIVNKIENILHSPLFYKKTEDSYKRTLSFLSRISLAGLFGMVFLMSLWLIIRSQSFIFQFYLTLFAASFFTALILFFHFNKKFALWESESLNLVSLAEKLGANIESVSDLTQRLDSIKESIESEQKRFLLLWGEIRTELRIQQDVSLISLENAKKKVEKLIEELDYHGPLDYEESRLNEIKTRVTRLNNDIEKKRKALDELEKHILSFRGKFESLDFNYFCGNPMDIDISTIESLRYALPRLDDLISEIEEKADLAKRAHNLFTQLLDQENRQIDDLFKKNNRASTILSKITNGHLRKISYDCREASIAVTRRTGQNIFASDLSRGEFGQVYVAIRVALAELLLGRRPAFFVMEDPFLPSDDERTGKLFSLLYSLVSKMKWQIIYFSSKKAICRWFEKQGAKIFDIKRIE
ncbi:MAG: ATP-binding protein [Candidatus Ranarchaeia archaeon]